MADPTDASSEMLDVVSRRPPSDEVRDPRLDAFRDRGGITRDASGRDGAVYIETETWWTTTGRLWWRHFSAPLELPHLWMKMPDGRFDDYVVLDTDLPTMVADWARGRLSGFDFGELDVDWLDESESARIRQLVGVPPRSSQRAE